MKLYRSIRDYGNSTILELVFAQNEEQVYEALLWKKEDQPPLQIEEITKKEGCILSVSVKSSLCNRI